MLTLSTAIIGSGAAGLAAAWRLALAADRAGNREALGQIALFTPGIKNSTSRNTGSDKQTYYKLSLGGDAADSPAAMARDLFAGRCVDGDHAMAEAALSSQCFYALAELGVPFPTNRYGEFIGYRTDHDTRGRATSAGPLTSKLMTEVLEREVLRLGVKIYDRHTVVRIVHDEKEENALGFVALNGAAKGEEDRFVPVMCKNIIWATGGPAGIYENTVYPAGHIGCSGVPLEAGVAGKNLTEWQYGLASTNPRWNVSGTYMQVLPRFVSVDPDGTEHEFLSEYFSSMGECLSQVFRKGYEWPFDSRRVGAGSSVVDLLVFRETNVRGRKVYLDFTRNPGGVAALDYDALDAEAHDYLSAAGACFGTPYERLCHMNRPAVDLYDSRGVDLSCQYLEIALCAQHCNGGLDVDLWWQTAIPGLFAIGEVAGTHGVSRPGGSALNAGQVGALRATRYIQQLRTGLPAENQALTVAIDAAAQECLAMSRQLLADGWDNTQELLTAHRTAMSVCASAIRDTAAMDELIEKDRALLEHFSSRVQVGEVASLWRAFALRDALITQIAVLTAMIDHIAVGGASRGSSIYKTREGTVAPGLAEEGDEPIRFVPDDGALNATAQTVTYDAATHAATASRRPVRPLPEAGGFFENVWRGYRENGNVY